jgi:hypothetical protein
MSDNIVSSIDYKLLLIIRQDLYSAKLSPRLFRERQDLCSSFQLVQIIAPELHHLLPLIQVRRPVVCASVWIAHSMRKLVLDVLGPDVKHLVEDCTGHGPEAVACHLVFAVPHAAQRSEDSIVAHRAKKGAGDGGCMPDNGQRKTPVFMGFMRSIERYDHTVKLMR